MTTIPNSIACGECGHSWPALAGHTPRYCPACGARLRFVPEPPAERELYMEEVIGWRAWEVHTLGKLVRLGSVSVGAHWPVRDWVYAECGGHRVCESSSDGRVPGEECTCGLYSASSYEHLMSLTYGHYDNRRVRVIGQVANAGKVIVGTQGWRAEKARVHHLYVPHTHWKVGKALSEQYGVPYDTLRWLG